MKCYIFYALVTEQKDKTLKFSGPFIHSKPAELVDHDDERFLFDKDNLQEEFKYLTASIAEKHNNSIPMLQHAKAKDPEYIIFNCGRCGKKAETSIELADSLVDCPSCGDQSKLPSVSDINQSLRQEALFNIEDQFSKKFEIMRNNWKICSRRR